MYYDYITYTKNNYICKKGICINNYNLYVEIPYILKKSKNIKETRDIIIKIMNLKTQILIYTKCLKIIIPYYISIYKVINKPIKPIFYKEKFYYNNIDITDTVQEIIYQNIKPLYNQLLYNHKYLIY